MFSQGSSGEGIQIKAIRNVLQFFFTNCLMLSNLSLERFSLNTTVTRYAIQQYELLLIFQQITAALRLQSQLKSCDWLKE